MTVAALHDRADDRATTPQTPRELPNNMEAEQALLGALLTQNSAYDSISQITRADHFFVPVHGEIYRAIVNKITGGYTASPVTLKNQFHAHPELKEHGGGIYIAQLAGSVMSAVNARDYAETLRELHTRRTLISGLGDVIDNAYSAPLLQRGTVTEQASQCVNSVIDELPSAEYTAKQATSQSMDFIRGMKSGRIKAVRTGISQLDHIIQGLYPSLLYVLAGRPGMGKTALALNIAENVAAARDNGYASAFFSIEMGVDQLGMRLLARHSGVDTTRQISPDPLAEHEWTALDRAQHYFDDLPLTIEDCAGASLNQIVSKARKFRRTLGRFVMFIDYLGLIRQDHRSHVHMVHQIAEITSTFKALAKELDIPIVLLSQLSRECEKREDKRPLKSDLRDSGAIEQDADVILFPYRHEYYLQREEPIERPGEGEGQYETRHLEWTSALMNARGKAEIIVAKNRFGRENTASTFFDGERQLFDDRQE